MSFRRTLNNYRNVIHRPEIGFGQRLNLNRNLNRNLNQRYSLSRRCYSTNNNNFKIEIKIPNFNGFREYFKSLKDSYIGMFLSPNDVQAIKTCFIIRHNGFIFNGRIRVFDTIMNIAKHEIKNQDDLYQRVMRMFLLVPMGAFSFLGSFGYYSYSIVKDKKNTFCKNTFCETHRKIKLPIYKYLTPVNIVGLTLFTGLGTGLGIGLSEFIFPQMIYCFAIPTIRRSVLLLAAGLYFIKI